MKIRCNRNVHNLVVIIQMTNLFLFFRKFFILYLCLSGCILFYRNPMFILCLSHIFKIIPLIQITIQFQQDEVETKHSKSSNIIYQFYDKFRSWNKSDFQKCYVKFLLFLIILLRNYIKWNTVLSIFQFLEEKEFNNLNALNDFKFW